MNILIIDDDSAILSMMKAFLQKHRHSVRTAQSVLPGFEILQRRKIDVILMDLDLPGLDGISLTRKIKTYPSLASIPIIAITGRYGQAAEHNALRAGCSHYLQKPIDTEHLLKLLRNLGELSEKNSGVVAPTHAL